VSWLIDGQVGYQTLTSGSTSSWAIDRPAPGDHTVAVSAYDANTLFGQVAAASASVRRGSNTTIPPEVQAAAAGATALTIGAWLWLEFINNVRAAQAAAEAAAAANPPPRADVPSWIYDPRPLAQIWAEEAHYEAVRHGYTGVRWDPGLNAFVTEAYENAQLEIDIQREAANEWHQLITTLDNSPGLSDLAEFAHHAEVHVVLPDGSIDIEALGNVQAAIDRLGQLELGIQRTPEYTYSDAAWQTVQEVADSTAIRVLVGVGVGGPLGYPLLALGLDAGFQAGGMILRSEQMVQAGMSDAQIQGEMLNQAVAYGGMVVIGAAGGQLLVANGQWLANTAASGVNHVLAQLPDDVAAGLVRTGQYASQTVQQLYHAGSTPVSTAFDEGLSATWQHAGMVTRIGQLANANPALGQAVDDLVQQMDEVGHSAALGHGGPLNWADERVLALYLDDPAAYQQALRDGLIPDEIQRLFNSARDKTVKDAITKTFDDIGDQKWLIDRVDITGTGANPLGTKATSGWTDVDLTAHGSHGVDRNFQQAFYQRLDDGLLQHSGLDREGFRELFGEVAPHKVFDVTCHPGYGGPGGYNSPGLLNWTKVEAHFTGRSVAVSEGGDLIFGYRPDATLTAPHHGGSLGQAPIKPLIPPKLPDGAGPTQSTIDDAIGLITKENTLRPPTSVLDNLRANGKHAQRLWKINTVGTGEAMPEGIKVLEMMKADRHWVPSPSQLQQAAMEYEKLTTLSAGG
jgi:hypothetical protein